MTSQVSVVLEKIDRLLDQPQGKPENSINWKTEAKREINRIVPQAYRSSRLKDFEGMGVMIPQHGVFLSGRTGTGKTHLATALMIDLMRPDNDFSCGCSIGWQDVPGLLCRIRSSFREGRHESEMDIIAEMVGYGCLVLDDLGAEKQTDFSAATLYTIISRRRNAERTTIVTSNQTLAEINAWEPRLASRLAEFDTYKLPEKDRRVMVRKGAV